MECNNFNNKTIYLRKLKSAFIARHKLQRKLLNENVAAYSVNNLIC